MEKILIGLLTKTLNMSEDEIKSLIYKEDSEDELKEDALQLLIEKDASRITGIKDTHKTEKEDQYKRGQRETSESIEKLVKSTFGIDSDLKGEALLAEAKAKSSDGSGGGDELTEDNVKSHAVYITLQNEKKKEVEDANKDWQKKYDDREVEYNSGNVKLSVHQAALAHVRGKNPKLPEETSKADKRLKSFLPELDQYDFEAKDGSYIVKTKDGQQLTDKHDVPITFDVLIDSLSDTYFDFEEVDPKGGKGTDNKNKFDKKPFDKSKTPTTPEELQTALDGAKTSEARTAISEAFFEAQKTTEE